MIRDAETPTDKVQLRVLGQDEDSTSGTAEIRELTRGEVLKNVLKILGLFWGLALLSVFLPVIHFFLVPAFILSGLAAAVRARKHRQEIVQGSVSCPNCSALNQLQKKSVLWPQTETCASCSCVFRIVPRELQRI